MLENLKKKLNLEKYMFILIMIIIIGLPALKLLSYILFTSGIITDSFDINHVYLLWITIPFLFVLYVLNISFIKCVQNYIDAFYSLAFLVFIFDHLE